ncbi:hypothetical protein NDU88_001312 [Pleurodeles waltl]|uniref:Uncharacterized protein n=1 Tax=Pleurodeles waltl TaxID=8319 RepID=A0AAV7U7J3_PLEWA|nr:hypothetical protein NDU88_001312 [Pleurodeles waltl]
MKRCMRLCTRLLGDYVDLNHKALHRHVGNQMTSCDVQRYTRQGRLLELVTHDAASQKKAVLCESKENSPRACLQRK